MKIGNFVFEKVNNFAFESKGFVISMRYRNRWHKIFLYRNTQMKNKSFIIFGKDINGIEYI